MFKVILLIALCVSNILAMPLGLHESVDGGEIYVLAPLSRIRREAIFGGPTNQLGASVFGNNKFGPPTIGGQLEYTHVPSRSYLNLGASHTGGLGTEFNAKGAYNVYRNPDTRIDATGYYSKTFGGPPGTGNPNYGIGVEVRKDFF